MSKSNHKRSFRQVIFQSLLLIVTSGLAFVAVFYISPSKFQATDLKAGDVASQDILAPNAISYNSTVLTEELRAAAIRDVSGRYSAADTSIARQQLERLRGTLAYISSIRADIYADTEQKLVDIAASEDLQLNPENASLIIELSDSRWQTIQQESIVVLEQVMRNTIRDSQLAYYQTIAPNLVSLALSEDQANLVAVMVAAFIAPNSFYSESLTEAAREAAALAVEPVIMSFATGETIVERGEVVSNLDVEALQQLGLAEPEIRWQDYASVGALVVLSASLIIIFFARKTHLVNDTRGLFIIAILFIIFLVAARLVLPIHTLTPFIFPIAAFALVVSGLFGAQPALVITIPLIILSIYGQANSFELLLYYALSSIIGVLIPRQEQRITGFIWVGLSVAASGAIILTIYRLLDRETTATLLTTLSAMALIYGLAAAGFTVLAQFLLAPALGQTTPLQLLELSRPDHPLLEYLLRSAPGTYQHSLQVANLAEQAAERIDADSLLTRVGALYHDIGKAMNASYFIENQVPGQLDTHDNLDPEISAGYIRDHVTSGVDLAREHRLPLRIQSFITEHHGTFKTRYQWAQAVKAANGDISRVNEEKYRYIGPRPQSRETALVMLADGTEARVRAKRPSNEDELRLIIRDTVDTCMAAGQLDDTPLTMQDLNTIVDSFTATLRGIYHPRVEYPTVPAAVVKNNSNDSGENGDREEALDPSADTPPPVSTDPS